MPDADTRHQLVRHRRDLPAVITLTPRIEHHLRAAGFDLPYG
ncbi:hypothetical protein [Mobilicoccus caccae]|nr:hypothetical protein [Mobilicoccus caccae]